MAVKRGKAIDFGVFLVSLGLILLLITTGVLDWSIINSLFVLWPLILVVIGVGIIFRNNSIVRAVAWILFLAVLISYSYFAPTTGKRFDFYFGGKGFHIGGKEFNFDDGRNDKEKPAGYNVAIDGKAGIKKGKLRVSIGGSNLIVDSDTDKLLEAELNDKDITYTDSYENDAANLHFKKSGVTIKFDGDKINDNIKRNTFHINKNVAWDLLFETGAVSGDFDLSDIKADKIDIDSGAADIDLKLGKKSENVDISIDSGFSKIDISVPDESGVRAKIDGAFSDTNFDEPEWEKRGEYYYSKGYNKAKIKIHMDINMAFGEVKVVFD